MVTTENLTVFRGTRAMTSGASCFVLSMLVAGEGRLESGSVSCVIQQEGNPLLSISVQIHSAHSRAAFHCASEWSISEWGVDRSWSLALSVNWTVEACAIVLTQPPAYGQ